ncbi:MAG TPA: DUF4388 domain-containing protein [Sandaracinaceae bacterium LLY-WYZ-13_1]|nr:DUF4388 domain-containing protein [Sandaracinaceae bacterium LLY-WYZ-13_1]
MSRVLLVHADPAHGARVAAELTGAGLTTRVVTSGERAMDRFVQEPADVLVIDYHLEGRDGVSTAEAVRWMPGGRRARVILTAEEEPEDGPLAELGRDVDAFATLVGTPDLPRLKAHVARAAAMAPHEAETRVLSAEQALLNAERARLAGEPRIDRAPEEGWQETTSPSDETALANLSEPLGGATPRALALDDDTLDEPTRAAWEFRDTGGVAEGREVRALAEATQQAHSDLLGSFEKIPFARLLGRLADKKATGALICVHPPDERSTTEGTEPTKVVYFRAGVPVHVRSNLVAECLGHVLARQRRIGPATLQESISAIQRGEGRQGEVLVRMGAIGPLELSEALADQLRAKLFDLFGWRRGTFRFAADRAPPRELIDLELGLAEIVYRGICRTTSPEAALEQLDAQRGRYLVPRARHMVRFVRLPALDAGLNAMVRRIDGRHRVAEVLEEAPSPGEAARLIVAMECLDAVRFAAKPLRPAAAEERSGSAVRPAPRPAPARVASLPSVPSAAVAAPDPASPSDAASSDGWDVPTDDGSPASNGAGAGAPAPDDDGSIDPEAAARMAEAVADAGDLDGRATIPEPEPTDAESTRADAPGPGAPNEPASLDQDRTASPDAGSPEAGSPDAGSSDAGSSDAGSPDAGSPDAGSPDAGSPDAGSPDAGSPDAEAHTIGAPEAATNATRVGARPPRVAAAPRLGHGAVGTEGAHPDESAGPDADEEPASSNAASFERVERMPGAPDAPIARVQAAPRPSDEADGDDRRAPPVDQGTAGGTVRSKDRASQDRATEERVTDDRAAGAADDAPGAEQGAGDVGSAVGGVPSSAPGDARGGTDRSAGGLDERVERLLRAERHFRRGQRALDRRRWSAAVEALSEAAALCPDEGKFLAFLAYAEHAAAPDDARLADALARAERACGLSPNEPGPHRVRARLAREAGRLEDARASWRRVLALAPDDAEAREALDG